jgi:hypothetical protein
MHAHGLAGRKETNTGVKVDAGGLVSVVNRGGGPPLDKGVGAMEAGGVGRARGMGMSSSDRRGQLMRERERESWCVGPLACGAMATVARGADAGGPGPIKNI